jgi:hypothetical protein
MDSRSTFLHHLKSVITMGGRRRISIHTTGNVWPPGRGSLLANPEALNLEHGGDVWLRPYQLAESKLPRKSSKEFFRRPYRKPTQVDEERILRRTCDPSFRNSAI